MTPSPFLTRVVLKNYKSIVACDVRLGALTYLVGPNGAGKSNFLDALQFVADALSDSLESALTERWGLPNVLHRNAVDVNEVGVRLELCLPGGACGYYAFELRHTDGGYIVGREECELLDGDQRHAFAVSAGQLEASSEPFPATTMDRLALVRASGLRAFRPVFDALVAMSVYRLEPRAMRALQMPQDGRALKPSGENIASVLARMRNADWDALNVLEQYLRIVVPAVHGVDRFAVDPMETVVFKQSPDLKTETKFYANSMSDGTLRALGVLTALFQGRSTLIGLEEPEAGLHPGAFAAIREAIIRASEKTQVVVASHSPDLLDDMELRPEDVLVVGVDGGATTIVGVDEGARDTIRARLFSAGELLRLNQLAQDDEGVLLQRTRQPSLWGPSP